MCLTSINVKKPKKTGIGWKVFTRVGSRLGFEFPPLHLWAAMEITAPYGGAVE
jgi:hypothetical protein